MDFLKRVSAVVTDVADAFSDASRRLALMNRLKAIERAENSKSHAAYEKMGRYLAEHLPEDAPEEIRALGVAARKAEEHAALARKHIDALKGTGVPMPVKPAAEPVADAPVCDPVVVPQTQAECPVEEPAEEAAAEAVEATVEPTAEPVAEEDPEEAAEDENDGIPFM